MWKTIVATLGAGMLGSAGIVGASWFSQQNNTSGMLLAVVYALIGIGFVILSNNFKS